jgi:hypothetical protein
VPQKNTKEGDDGKAKDARTHPLPEDDLSYGVLPTPTKSKESYTKEKGPVILLSHDPH